MNSTSEITALRSIWTEAERKLYPLATVSPEKYEQVIRLARAVADSLAGVTSADALAQRWVEGSALVSAAAEQISLPVGDLPPDNVAGVGFALRDAEIRALEHQEQLASTIADAGSRGEAWATLHEQGNLKHGLMDPYSAIQLHIASGAAIVSSVEPNPVDGQANHVLTVIRMDSATGAPVDIDPGIAATQEHATFNEFLVAREALISQIDSAT